MVYNKFGIYSMGVWDYVEFKVMALKSKFNINKF
jgi:hypothetical protein